MSENQKEGLNTRKLSSRQEKRIASHLINGRQVIGSGSTPFLKGDVVTPDLFIEAKTRAKECTQITVKKEWLDKAREQAFSTGKTDYALSISMGDGKDYFVIEDSYFYELYRAAKTLQRIKEELM